MPPMGLAYLAAALEARGHTVQIIDANLEGIDPEDIAVHVKHAPDVIGMTVNILTIRMALVYGAALKAAFSEAQLLFGGPHASVMRATLLEKNPLVDAVIMGEGEATLAEIAPRIGHPDCYEGVLGVVYRKNGQIVDNGPRPLIENIDTIPMPAYHLLPHLSRYRSRSRGVPVGYVLSSRGCPAACTFCYRSFGKKWRVRSPENVVEEIAYLREKYGIRQLDILDDNFAFDARRAEKIMNMIIEKKWDLKINLQVGVRVESLDMELLKTMKRAGVFKFGFGIESGDAGILRRIKKGLDLEKSVQLIRAARALGFITHGFFIMGFPGETPETMQKTIDFAKRLDPHYASFSICTPLPGTEMYDEIARNGVFLEDVADGIDEGLFALKAFFKYGQLDPEDVVCACERAWREFYARPGKILDVLWSIRSWGEFSWLCRVVGDILQTKQAGRRS